MMAKDRRQRYPAAEDLILDLECLLNGQPPKLARARIADGTLQELAEGEVEDDVEETVYASADSSRRVWMAILAAFLAISLLLNLILVLKSL